MGHKASKTKSTPTGSREGSVGSFRSDSSTEGDFNKKQKKQSRLRRLTKAFSKTKVKPQKKEPDNTYASSLQVTLKRTNSDSALDSHPSSLSASSSITRHESANKNTRLPLSPLHSQSITPISFSPRSKAAQEAFALARSETISAPHTTNYNNDTNNTSYNGTNAHNNDHGAKDEGEQGTNEEFNLDGADILPPEEIGKSPKVRRATSTSSFLKYESGRRAVEPKRMSRALVFHQQIAAKEVTERGAELHKILQQEKPVCDIFEDNPFRKGWCRLCKHPKDVHKDPYSDILDELEEF